MEKSDCTHPNHNNTEDCRERAVGCDSECPCCHDEWTRDYYRNLKKVENKS